MVGSPAGGSWITAEDLAKFGQWIYKQVKADAGLELLMQKYGQEFYDAKSQAVYHPGGGPSSSAWLSVSLKTGAVVATLSDQPAMAGDLHMVQRHVFASAGKETSLDQDNEQTPLHLEQ